jgi:hypothetical protein
MILTHQQLLDASREYNTLFSKNEFYPLQKAYTTPHFLVFTLRFPGKTLALYIGRGNGYEGVFLSEHMPPSYLRTKDKLLDYCRKYLVGARLGKMKIDSNHHVFHFDYKREHSDFGFSFGYKDHQLFFINREKDQIYSSWDNEISNEDLANKITNFLGSSTLKNENRTSLPTIETYLESEEKKMKGKPFQKKKEKFLDKKLKNISSDLASVKKWIQMEIDLTKDKVNLEGHEIIFHGHKFKFLGEMTFWQKKDLIFQKIKKLKKGQTILEQRLLETEQEISQVKAGKFEYETTKEKVIEPLWISRAASKKNVNFDYAIKNFKLKKMSGVIALDARSNDWIRSQAAKDHWWFHIDQYQGSHLILKTDDIGELTQLDLSAIASILRDFSKLTLDSIPMVYSQVKNIKGMKGSQGKVIINKPKYLQCEQTDWSAIITLL